MIVLVLGVLIWAAAHLFRRVAPEARARMGGSGRMVMGLAAGLATVLMIWGFRSADFVPVYTPVPGIGHLNNLLMLVSLFLFAVGGTKGTLYPRLRNPMLWGVIVWVVAHLLVNGDLASILLFGGMGLWAVVQMAVINRTPWERPGPVCGLKGDLMAIAGTLVLYGIIAGIHIWAGHNPFLGTYG